MLDRKLLTAFWSNESRGFAASYTQAANLPDLKLPVYQATVSGAELYIETRHQLCYKLRAERQNQSPEALCGSWRASGPSFRGMLCILW
jgi:hypothetical protein